LRSVVRYRACHHRYHRHRRRRRRRRGEAVACPPTELLAVPPAFGGGGGGGALISSGTRSAGRAGWLTSRRPGSDFIYIVDRTTTQIPRERIDPLAESDPP